MERLDKLDKKILNIVMSNARMASKDIASSAVCRARPSTSACNASWT